MSKQTSRVGITMPYHHIGFGERRRWLTPSLIVGGWTLFGLFFACQRYIERAYAGSPTTWRKVLTAWLICAYLWAALTPLTLWLARRFPIERRRWAQSLLVHACASLVISTVHLVAYLFLLDLLSSAPHYSFASFESLRISLIAQLHFNLLLYWSLIGISRAFSYYEQKREQELTASRLEAALARSQLDALKLQLHPHFLFNALNSISVLMFRDVQSANRTLLRLSDLLRAMLSNNGRHEVSLSQELMFLRSYLEIEQTRFSDRLTVKIVVAPGAEEALVPTLILQPLVENAILHGIAPRSDAGHVEIRAERVDGAVRLQVCDDGPGVPKDFRIDASKRIGLANTRARLLQMYGTRHQFELSAGSEGGLVVTVTIPFHQAADTTRERETGG